MPRAHGCAGEAWLAKPRKTLIQKSETGLYRTALCRECMDAQTRRR